MKKQYIQANVIFYRYKIEQQNTRQIRQSENILSKIKILKQQQEEHREKNNDKCSVTDQRTKMQIAINVDTHNEQVTKN